METKKVLGIIFSLVFIGVFIFTLCWGIINFNKVKDGLSGTGIYTEEDVNNAYEDGYDEALSNKTEYDELINGYKDTITNQTDEISKLNSQVSSLTNTNKDYSIQIDNLRNQKSNLETQVTNLNEIKVTNETLISELNAEITSLENEIANLESDKQTNSVEMQQKNEQIARLQDTVAQLQKTHELNVNTIDSLNSQIASLNSQISDMTIQIQNNSSNVTTLNAKIAELEKSVAYYEEYIANLESGEQVVATFEFNGSVYNIQVVNKNTILSIADPESTEYTIFNYWTVDGERIDLSTYKITQNTKIVANVTYKYDVVFMVDNETYDSQVIVKNGYAVVPESPSKEGYEFDGWTLNGNDIVNPANTGIIQKTIYTAKFTKLHTVTFIYEDATYNTQTIRNGNYASEVSVSDSTYKVFNGWTLNGSVVDIKSQRIVADTTFIASVTYKYDVVFKVDNATYKTQIVIENGYATIPTAPSKSGYDFDGWTLNGSTIVNINQIPIIENTTFVAKFTKLHTVKFIYEGSTTSTQTVRNGNYATSVIVNNTDYVIFNGWMVNGSIVSVNNYAITQDTTFTASVTYKYAVTFIVDEKTYSSQVITSGGKATVPSNPSKVGYTFLGWSVDGSTTVNVSSYSITKTTRFVALFKNKMDGTYKFDCYMNDMLINTWQMKISNGQIVQQTCTYAYDTSKQSMYYTLSFTKTSETTLNCNIDIVGMIVTANLNDTLTYNQTNDTWSYLFNESNTSGTRLYYRMSEV